jgi:hypothetical protein
VRSSGRASSLLAAVVFLYFPNVALRDRIIRVGHVNPREDAFAAPQEAVAMLGDVRRGAGDDLIVLMHIVSHNLTDVVDPNRHRPKNRVIVRHVERGEDAFAPDEAMTFLTFIPIGSDDLPLRVEEAALRSDLVRVIIEHDAWA